MKRVSAFVLALAGLASVFAASESFAGSESFRQSCRIRYEDQNRIQADCADTRGGWVYNDYRRGYCAGDLANYDGRIACTNGGGGGGSVPPSGALPRGSYQQSCNSCSVNGPNLQCQCQDTSGNWRWTAINYTRCRSEIANSNGQLICN